MAADPTELFIERTIAAPVAKVWLAWSRPEHLAQWWIPAPMECRVDTLDLRPGGGFVTRMREPGGDFQPHLDACFLDIAPEQRIVFTTVLRGGWQPVEPWLAMTAIITFTAEGQGTRYAGRVLHRTGEDARKHEDLGFLDGWGTVIGQLEGVARAV